VRVMNLLCHGLPVRKIDRQPKSGLIRYE